MTRVRISAALCIASLAMVAGLAGCSDDSASDTTQVEVADGVTISVPSDLADQPPKQAVTTVLDSVADDVGFSDEWQNCIATELDAIPDARFDAIDELGSEARTQAALKYNAQISDACGKKVAVVVSSDATSEQIDALRALTASQLSQTVTGGQITEEQTTCFVEQYKALSNDQVVEFANFSTRQTLQTMRGWFRACEKGNT